MSDNATTDNVKGPWTIKGIDTQTRNLIIACAAKRDVNVGDWIATAAKDRANIEAGDLVTFPGQQSAQDSAQRLDSLTELTGMLNALTQASAASGVGVQKRILSGATKVLDAELRQRLGLPQLAQRKSKSKSITVINADRIGQPAMQNPFPIAPLTPVKPAFANGVVHTGDAFKTGWNK